LLHNTQHSQQTNIHVFSEIRTRNLSSRAASCTGSFPGLKSGRGVTLTPHPFSYRGQERVDLYLCSRYGPYALYRASVPVQGCTLPYLTLPFPKNSASLIWNPTATGRWSELSQSVYLLSSSPKRPD